MKETDLVFPGNAYRGEYGINVRDYIAIQAMAGLCANSDLTTRAFDEIADMAYLQADEMIKRSER